MKAFLQHPGLDGLKLNQNYAEDELNRALDCFCDAVQGDRPHDEFAFSQHGKLNELALNFEKFQVNFVKKYFLKLIKLTATCLYGSF